MLVLIVMAALAFGVQGDFNDREEHRRTQPWGFSCIEGRCQRGTQYRKSLHECKLTCRNTTMLWPLPTSFHLGNEVVSLPIKNIVYNLDTPSLLVHEMTERAVKIFLSYFGLTTVVPSEGARYMKITIDIKEDETQLTYDTDESYTLTLKDYGDIGGPLTKVFINSSTYFGARHALETLSQLIYKDENNPGHLIVINYANITDKPAYVHRGITIDTSRNYYPIEVLKRVVDGMSYNKLNILHWHITDTTSFPFISRREPNMAAYGAYNWDQTYHPSDLKAFVDYARIRGVKIIPELDTPAHVGHGWEWGEKKGKGRFVVCLDVVNWQRYCLQPPCGQINPVNNYVYHILENIYRDLLEVFDNDIFHFGGDEISKRCWTDPAVAKETVEWLTNRSFTTNEGINALREYFTTNAYKALKQANGEKDIVLITWSNSLTNLKDIEHHVDKARYIIQIYANLNQKLTKAKRKEHWSEVVRKGYKVILSNSDALYLDCGFGTWLGGPPRYKNNYCSPYKSWNLIYENRPEGLLLNQTEGVLGQEVNAWSEQIDEHSIEGRLWPRTSALAERTWSDPKTGWMEAEPRILAQRERMVQRGLHPERLQPQWCYEHEERCFAR